MIRDLNQLEHAYNKAVKAKGLQEPGKDATEEEKKEYEQSVKDAQLSVLDLEIFENTAFIMARQYDTSVPATPEEWLEEFSMFSIYEVLPQILELWRLNQQTTAKPKKK